MSENKSATEKIVNLFLKRLSDKDAYGIASLFADNIDWYVPGNTELPWVGSRSNPSEVANYFLTMWPNFVEGKSETRLDKIIINGQDAVLFADFTHTAVSTGRFFQIPIAMHLVIKDGKIVKLKFYEDTWKVSKAFFDS